MAQGTLQLGSSFLTGVPLRPASRCRFLLRLCLLLAITISGTMLGAVPAAVGQGEDCSYPFNVSQDIAPFSAFAHLAADRYGRLHMIWSSGVSDGRNEEQVQTDTIFYTVWKNGAWTKPVDILTDADYATADSIVISQDDRLLISWRNRSNLFVSQADLLDAGSALNWKTQDMGLGSVADSDLFADADNNVHMIYAAHVPARGFGALGYQVLRNVTGIWSRPQEFVTFDGSTELLTNIQIHADELGGLHSVWNRNTAADDWMPVGVYYARSDDRGETWSEPEEAFAGARAAYPELSHGARPGRYYLTWLRGVGHEDSKYIRGSDSNGEFWTSPRVVFNNLQGLNGAMPIVFDSSGTEYWVMSGDAPNGSTQIRYSRQSNDSGWRTPVPLSPDLRDSEFPEATVINGNELHIVWNEFATDDVYHVICQLDAPRIAPAPVPSPGITTVTPAPELPTAAAKTTATAAPRQSPGDAAHSPFKQVPPHRSMSSVQTVLLAVIPSLLLVAGVILWHANRIGGRRQ